MRRARCSRCGGPNGRAHAWCRTCFAAYQRARTGATHCPMDLTGLVIGPRVDAQPYVASLLADPCAYCGGRAEERDHIVPRARVGGDKGSNSGPVSNLTGACARCNQAKGDRPLLLWLLG